MFIDVDGVYDSAILVTLGGGIPIDEHFDDIDEVHFIDAILEELRVMPVIFVMMLEGWLQLHQALVIFR